MTYTVLDAQGEVQEHGLTREQAAITVLQYDGHTYSIRPSTNTPGFDLFVSPWSRNNTCYNGETKTMFYSLNTSQAHAESEIWRKVIAEAESFEHQTVMTDAAFAEMLAEADRDDARTLLKY